MCFSTTKSLDDGKKWISTKPLDHNHPSVEEQDLCTIQASHAVLHRKNSDEGAILKKDANQ
jgi:hypothetical protein